jgi:hypothetical protein
MVSSAEVKLMPICFWLGNRQRGVLLVVVLNLQRGTVGHQSAIRQTNPQGRADLGTFNGKAVVVLFIARCGKLQGCSQVFRDTSL